MMTLLEETLAQAAEDHNIDIPQECLKDMAEAVLAYHEYCSYSNPRPDYDREVRELKEDLERERSKVVCPACKGRGSITTHGPCHSATSSCWRCGGEGKVTP